MKKINKKNKLSKRIIISSLVLSSLTSASLYFYPSINKNGLNSIEENSFNKSNELSKSIGPKLVPTTIVPRSGISPVPYPFQITTTGGANGLGNFLTFFVVQGGGPTPSSSNLTFGTPTITNLNGANGATTSSYTIQVTMNPHVNSAGVLTNTDGQFPVTLTGLRNVANTTRVLQNSIQPNPPSDNNTYASDKLSSTDNFADARRYLSVENSIDSIAAYTPNFPTELRVNSVTADNLSGTLFANLSLINWVNSNGQLMSGEANKLDISALPITGFKQVPGPTNLLPVTSSTSITLPSDIVGREFNSNTLTQFFQLTNSYNSPEDVNTTRVESVRVISGDNEKGTVEVEFVVSGGYINSDNVPIRETTNATIRTTVNGFISQPSGPDALLPVWIGIGGGVGALVLIALVVILVIMQKKKNEEARKKRMMAEKLNMVGPGNKSGSVKPIGGIGGLAPGMAPRAANAGPSKYVPPTISIPKSNAPQVKKPTTPPVKK